MIIPAFCTAVTAPILGHRQPASIGARFVAKIKVDQETGCWLWHGYVGPTGYGQFMALHIKTGTTKVQGVHRLAWEALNGPVPPGLDIDHLCRVRHCCNPAHLEPVTRQVNLLRGQTIPAAKAAQTHCEEGHELAGENLYVARNGTRTCRICKAARYAKWLKRNRGRRREIDRNSYHNRKNQQAAE